MSEPVLVVCPHCHAPNRVPAARLGEGPACGRCRGSLFVGRPVALDGASFEAHVGRGGLPVLVDFWAPWCAPCRMMAPQFEAAAAQLEPGLRLAKVDTEAEPALGARHDVRGIPTLVLFHRGHELARRAGAIPTAEIVDWARRQLG